MASGYNGGESVSSANQQLFEDSAIPRKYYEFSFMNEQKCSVKVNGSNPIPCPAGIGFEINSNDAPIQYFEIIEANIPYTWRGKF